MVKRPTYEELEQRVKELEEKIAECKRAQEVLRERERWFRFFFESAPEFIYIIDTKGNILQTNDATLKVSGYLQEEVLGKCISDFFTLTSKKIFDEQFPILLERGHHRQEVEFICKDGKIIILDCSVSALRYEDGDIMGFVVFQQDITQRRQAEEALRKSEAKYCELIFRINEGFAAIDEKGYITFVNPRLCEMIEYSEVELIGRNIRELFDEKNREILEKELAKRRRGEPSQYELTWTTKSGKKIPTLMSASPIFENWVYRGSYAVVTDLSEIKRAQEEKKRLEAQLHKIQRMESLGTLAGGIAHNFNNLLMGILGNISLILLNKNPSHPDYEKLKNVEHLVQEGAKLSQELLDFARGGKFQVEPTDLNKVVKRSSDMFAQTKRQIKIYTKFQKDIWTVEVDVGQIEQVLLNLYINAWQAMPGGGELYLETQNITLDENYVRPFKVKPGPYVKISVTDTGVGMDETTKQRIFEPFFTTKEGNRGTGLGLASAYGIIKNHGGIITVYSEKGRGTTFNIYLPASEKEAIKQEKLAEGVLKGGETILFVDDEEMIIKTGKELLETLGYKVLIAKSGKEVIEIYRAKNEQIDMVILDTVMPDIGGGEIYDMLKKINPDIKVLLSSGYSMNDEIKEILERGCDGFIQKPFTLKELSRKIRKILDKE